VREGSTPDAVDALPPLRYNDLVKVRLIILGMAVIVLLIAAVVFVTLRLTSDDPELGCRTTGEGTICSD